MNSMLPASPLSWSMKVFCEPNVHSYVWMLSVSSPHRRYAFQAYCISYGHHQISPYWSLSKGDHLDSVLLSEDTPNRNLLASLSVDVHNQHSVMHHKPRSVLIHILWLHPKSVMVVYLDFHVFSAEALVSLLLRFCLLHVQHEGNWTALSATPESTFIWFLFVPPFLPLLPT